MSHNSRTVTGFSVANANSSPTLFVPQKLTKYGRRCKNPETVNPSRVRSVHDRRISIGRFFIVMGKGMVLVHLNKHLHESLLGGTGLWSLGRNPAFYKFHSCYAEQYL
jgi:hypothetical protein